MQLQHDGIYSKNTTTVITFLNLLISVSRKKINMKNLQPFFFKWIFFKTVPVKKIFTCAFVMIMVLHSAAQECKIYSGTNLVMNGAVYFVINNTAFKNNGTFTASTSNVSFTGNTDTTIAYISGTSNTRFYNLTLDKSAYGVAVKSATGVKNVLTATAGILYADSNLTLLSDASNTSRLATVPSGANVLGKVMVERYIPSRRAWRLMTAPVTDASTIYQTWQNNGVYAAGRGLLISGPTGTGMDNTHAYSLKEWDVSSQTLLPVTNTTVPISPTTNGSADNKGYFVFIRGDRCGCNFIIPNTNTTTLTSIGGLQVGTQTFTASSTGGQYTLIGNPYASPIDFNSVSRTNLVKRFYVWDPLLNTLGGYVTLDDIDNDGTFTKSVSGSGQTKQIQSSQAFFVETNSSGAASLTVGETDKSTTNNSNVFRPLSGNGTESIRADLYLLNTDSSIVLADGSVAEYNSMFHDIVTNEDALKFTNINENIGMLRYGTTLSIERRPFITLRDTLFFKIWKTTQRNYQLQITVNNIDQPGLLAFLQDSYLATSSLVNLSGNTTVNFTVDANAASAASNRFRIVFGPGTILPVTFSSVTAYKVNDNIEVDWKVQDDANTVKYEVEKSINGVDFGIVNTAFKNTSGNYSWIDANAYAGKNFYRIKSIALDGSVKYSQVVSVMITKGIIHFTVEPNPVKGNTIHLHFANQPGGNYQFNLTNSAGQLVYSSKLQISNGTASEELKINTVLPTGLYQLQITSPSNNIETQKIIISQ